MSVKKMFFWLPLFILLALGLTTQAQGITIPSNTGLPDGSIAGVLTTTLNWLLMIFVIIATISFVITGLQFIFSFGGASGSEAQAKKNFAYTIIAIFVVGGSLIILKTVIGLLGPSTGGGNNNVITNGAGGYPDNDAIEGNNNAGLQNDASHNADNPTQNGVPSNSATNNGGYSDNDAIEGNNNAGLQNDASHNADNPTQNDPVVPGSNNLHQSDMPQNNF